MTKEHLQNLVDVHNILYNSPVSGSSIVPMAQAILKLQTVIKDLNAELSTETKEETANV